jgi:hypothetical protein
MRRLSLAAFIAALLAAACAPHMGASGGFAAQKSGACKSQGTTSDCDIVVDAWSTGDNSCDAAVLTSQQLVGFDKNAKNKKIEWRFTEKAEDDGFRFLPNGIEPKSTPTGNARNWNDNFEADTVAGGKTIKLKNTNKQSQPNTVDYHYLVRVQWERPHLAPVACNVRDPVIRNQR